MVNKAVWAMLLAAASNAVVASVIPTDHEVNHGLVPRAGTTNPREPPTTVDDTVPETQRVTQFDDFAPVPIPLDAPDDVPANDTDIDSPDGNSTTPDGDSTPPGDVTTLPADNSTLPIDNSTLTDDTPMFPIDNSTFPSDNSTLPSDNTTLPDDPTTLPDDDFTLPDDGSMDDTVDGETWEPEYLDTGFAPVTACMSGAGPQFGCGECIKEMSYDPVPLDQVNFTDFDNTQFGSVNGGGGETWFSVPKPKDNCMVLFFRELGGGLAPAYHTPGLLAAYASSEGCYYMNTDEKIAVSWCCGEQECKNIGKNLVLPADPQAQEMRTQKASVGDLSNDDTTGNMNASENAAPSNSTMEEKRSLAQLNKRALVKRNDVPTKYTWENTHQGGQAPPSPPQEEEKEPEQTCEPATEVEGGQNYLRAGWLEMLTRPRHCNEATVCTYGMDESKTTTASLDISNSTTETEDTSLGISVTAGWQAPIGPTGSVTANYNAGWSTAIQESMGVSKSNSTTKGTSYSLQIKPGTWGQFAVVPVMECRMMKAKCKKGDKEEEIRVDRCVPTQEADPFIYSSVSTS